MGVIRVVTWNLNHLTRSKASDSARAGLINAVVTTSGIDADIFVVLEVGRNTKSTNPGEPLLGSGALGSMIFLSKLQSTNKSWRLVPPLCLCNSADNEGCSVYFRSDRLDFDGPNDVDYSKSTFKGLEGPATIGRGAKVTFYEDGNSKKNEIWFVYSRNRRPHLVQFVDKKTSTLFRVLAFHAAPVDTSGSAPAIKNQEAFQGVETLAKIHEITKANDAAHVIVTGDFNCNAFDSEWKKAYNPLLGVSYTQQIAGVATTIQQAVSAKPTSFRTGNCFDNFFTKGLKLPSSSTTRPNVAVVDPVNGWPKDYPQLPAYAKGSYTPDDIPLNVFRSKENYENVRRTSDHLPIYIDIDL
jgi:hypothetical protein